MQIISGWNPRLADQDSQDDDSGQNIKSVSEQLLDLATDGAARLYAIVDASRGEVVLQELAAPGNDYQSLYKGEAEEKYFAVSPILVSYSQDSEVFRWLTSEVWGQSYAILFTSTASADDLVAHFRRLLTVVTESNEKLLFRFYDPRVLRVYLPTCNIGELTHFFGPVDSFLIETDKGIILDFDLGKHATGVVPTTARPTDSLGRLIIRKRQMKALAKDSAKRVREAQLQEFRESGFRATEAPRSGDLLLEDAAGSTSRISSLPDGALVTTAEGLTWKTGVDSRGRLTTLTDPSGFKVTFEHDQRDRLTRVRRGEQQPYELEFDEADNLATLRYPDKTALFLEYDDSRLVGVTDRNGAATRYQYDSDGLLTETTDPLGNSTLFEYEEWESPSRIRLPNGDAWSFEFDAQGRLKKSLVNDEEIANFEIGDNGRNIDIRYTDDTFSHFVIDNDKVLEASNELGTVKLEYDQSGHLISEEFEGQTVKYVRNGVGALVALVTPDGETLTFERDRDHRVRKVIDWEGKAYEIDYHDNGALATISYPNGIRAELGSTCVGLAESLDIFSPDADRPPIVSCSWKYDDCDRLIQDSDSTRTKEYIYDGEGRLLHVSVPGRKYLEHYELDANGNRAVDRNHDCRYSGFNQLLGRGQDEFRYDGRGNMTEGECPRGKASFRFNHRNQLIEIVMPTGSVRYAYDAFGRRVRKWAGNKVTSYVWAGQQLLCETTDGAEKPERRDYLFFPEAPVPLGMRVNGDNYYLHVGRRCEPLCMSDTKGQMVWSAEYNSFGSTTKEVGKLRQPWRLPGQYFDEETGLHYNFTRYYHPELGRFLSVDQLLHDGGSANFYSYCDGDPVNRVDPTGAFILAAIIIGAALGAVIYAGIESYRQSKAILGGKGNAYDPLNILYEAGIGAGVGALGGAVGSIGAMFSSFSLPVIIAGGGLSGGLSSAVEQCAEDKIRSRETEPGEWLRNYLIAVGLGALTAGLGAWIARRLSRGAQRAATEAAKKAEGKTAGRAVAGVKGEVVDVGVKTKPYAHLKDPPEVSAGKEFTPKQKARIIAENRKPNEGFVKSDLSGKKLKKPPQSRKGVSPSQDEWQIDHIIPRDKGGTNSYSNAQVLSREENRAKWNK